jgi:MFS family permease
MSGFGRSYRGYVLALLVAGYALNSFDRSILGILLEPIRLEFGLRDTQLGLLGGLAFAVVYSTFGIPLAMWADRSSRRNVLALAILVWSAMTVLCGLAVSFFTLVLARIGTAVGEAGGSPASQALISDYFPRERRATALGLFALGAPAGSMLAGYLGGIGNEVFGWRATFILAGIPGLLLAPLLFLTVREPRIAGLRLASASSASADLARTEDSIPLRTIVATLWGRASFRHLCMGCAFHAFAMYGAATFNAGFLIRSHGWGTGDVGKLFALIGAFGLLGTYIGGRLADQMSRRSQDERWYLWVPALASTIVVPFQLTAYLSNDVTVVVSALAINGLFTTMFFGPSFAASQALAEPRTRAVAAAMLILVKTLFGMGLGPLAIGIASDSLAPAAGQHSLRYALLLVAAVNIVSAAHFMRAGKALRADLGTSQLSLRAG